MGFFKPPFGGRKAAAKELISDPEVRWQLWKKHLDLYKQRSDLNMFFAYSRREIALRDLDSVDKVLRQMKGLINKDLVDIEDEQKVEKEIVQDLERLVSKQSKWDIGTWIREIKEETNTQENLLKIFNKIHEVLVLQLHAIDLCLKHPQNLREVIDRLFILIHQVEEDLYSVFRQSSFSTKRVFGNVERIARAILLEEDLEKVKIRTAKSAAEIMLELMREGSEHEYRKLGEKIFEVLAERVGARFRYGDPEAEKAIEDFEKMVVDNATLSKIIKDLKPEYSDTRIKQFIAAFNKACADGHFEGLEDVFDNP